MRDAIELKNINKSFQGKRILTDYSLTIKENSFISIVGESGTGKSTLLNIIGKLDQPDSGSIWINGKKAEKEKEIIQLKRWTFGYVFQDYALLPQDTVRQNLIISQKYGKNKGKDALIHVLQQVKLNESFLNQPVYSLSGGEQQRVAIARMLLKPFEIVLADEPTGNLDAKNASIIMAIFRELRTQGKTIVCVTHDPQVAALSDEIITLQKENREGVC